MADYNRGNLTPDPAIVKRPIGLKPALERNRTNLTPAAPPPKQSSQFNRPWN